MMQQQDDKWFIGHMEDLAVTADQTGYITFSDFLDDHQRSLLSSMEGRLPVCLSFFGGYPEAERQLAVFYPDYMKESLAELLKEELVLLQIKPLDQRFLKHIPGHRDYLGALMGTGIRRDKLGDLLTADQGAYLWVKKEISSYIQRELTSVGAAGVMVREVSSEELPKAQQGVLSVIIISSLRIDAVISRGFHMGRAEALKWIAAGRASRNGLQILEGDKLVSVGDKITLRGKGRLKILEDKGFSKSGRIQLVIEYLGDKK